MGKKHHFDNDFVYTHCSTLRKHSDRLGKKADCNFILKITELLNLQVIQMDKNQIFEKIFNSKFYASFPVLNMKIH